jgi:hypothetical protein
MFYLIRTVAVLSTWWPWFDPRSVNVEFRVDKVAVGWVFLPVIIISPVLLTHISFITHWHDIILPTEIVIKLDSICIMELRLGTAFVAHSGERAAGPGR